MNERKKYQMFDLLQKKWPILEELVYVLSVLYQTTVQLQARGLTLSDVYGIWIKMKLHLQFCEKKKKYKTKLATYLLAAMTERKNAIFKNPLMSAAIYLDPRYRMQIINNEIEVNKIIETLCNLFYRMNRTNSEMRNNMNICNISADSENADFNLQAAMHDFLEGNLTQSPQVASGDNVDIEHKLRMFQAEQMDYSKSVVEYWEQMKDTHPELYQLSTVIFALSPTEVENERDFSRLKNVFSNRRCNLAEGRLKDIILLHMNPDLFYAVKEDQISEILDQIQSKGEIINITK